LHLAIVLCVPPETATPGLRERKNLRTRQAIIRATAELTLEVGFAAATIPKIAERADVAPRTVSVWFPVKEDILFEDIGDQVARIEAQLRDGEGTVVDRLERWLAEESQRLRPDIDIAALRFRAILADPQLRARELQLLEPMRTAIARAAAHDLQEPEQSMRPQILATAAMGFLMTIRTQNLARAMTPEQRVAGLAFLRAGLASFS
jgi:AcrR family transcriptional regulator